MSSEIRFDGQVTVVTGAGGGLGRSYAIFYASRGATVVVNDLGGGAHGDGSKGTNMADLVVEEIRAAGGVAIPDYNSVTDGDKIIETAIKSFGRIDVLVNNAGILRDISFRNMTDKDWELIQAVHMFGTYKTTRAAWPYMKRQQYGRIICTASGAGIYGTFGQTNYSAAKGAIIGFATALAREGALFNIKCNTLAPAAASRLTATVMTPDLLAKLSPEWVVPVVVALTYKDCPQTGGVFEVGAGFVAKFRWQRASGVILQGDEAKLTPGAISSALDQVADFSRPSYAGYIENDNEGPRRASIIQINPPPKSPLWKDKVAIVIGVGSPVGRKYALALAKGGAKLIVNDISAAAANSVANEIRHQEGVAAAVVTAAEHLADAVKRALDIFGGVHIIIFASGLSSGRPLDRMSDDDWNSVYNSNMRAAYKVTKASWSHMVKQRFGRIVLTSSFAGLYGQADASNYSAATMGLVGFMRALFREGEKYNVNINVVTLPLFIPTDQTLSSAACLAAFLCSEEDTKKCTGSVYEVENNWIAQSRWQRSGGHSFPVDQVLTPEAVIDKWDRIDGFDERADYPDSSTEGMAKILQNLGIGKTYKPKTLAENQANQSRSSSSAVVERIKAAQQTKNRQSKYTYTDRELLLYNLSVGAKVTDLKWVFELDPNFTVLPTFGVIPQLEAVQTVDLSFLPNYSPKMILHGEQYLQVRNWPLPTSGTMITSSHLLSVADKQKAAVATIATSTTDAATGREYFYNECKIFIRGCGGFEVNPGSAAKDTSSITLPSRSPDISVVEPTFDLQGAFYRLAGDRNPLHIDPQAATAVGFSKPILHGLCTFGIAGRCIVQRYGMFHSIHARFTGTVEPGQMLRVNIWKGVGDSRRLIFSVVIVDTGLEALHGEADLQYGKGRPKKL